jgi:hypothetical protein
MPILPVNVFHILQANINLYPHQLESDAVLYFSPIPFIHNQWHCFPSIFRMDLGNCAHLLNTTYPDGLPESGILLISTSLLKALAYLHTNRIIHRSVYFIIFLNTGIYIFLCYFESCLRREYFYGFGRRNSLGTRKPEHKNR